VSASAARPLCKRAALFFDRDGTVIVDRDHLRDPAGVALLPGAGEALRALAEAGWMLVMVTNQSGVARGYFDLADVDAVNRRMNIILAAYGVCFDAIYVCPHGPASDCVCRKPAPGMLLSAADDHAIDLSRSFLIGDKLSDLEAAASVGSVGILVMTGQGPASVDAAKSRGWIVVADLLEAATLIQQAAGADQLTE